MRIKTVGFDDRSAVILGAGATRGAEFVKKRFAALPPLDGDFFTQAQRLSHAKPPGFVKDLIKHVTETFGKNFRLTMEGYLTKLEQLANVYDDYKLRGRPGENPYRAMRQHFLQVLYAVLDESVTHAPDCKYHRALVRYLATEDTVLSFNYDWLIDYTLKKYGIRKWNPRSGYGVPVYRGAGARYWACTDKQGRISRPTRSITLLKLHGSLNWFPVSADAKNPKLRLRERWWHQRGDLHFEIAPPEWNKPIRAGIYKPIWRMARHSIKQAKALIFVGYSLPDTDLPAQALLMVDAARAEDLELLVIVNPDRDARQRIRHALSRRLQHDTRVLTFDRFADFYRFLVGA